MAKAPGLLLAPGSRAPQPVEPVRQYSFTDFQVNNPVSPPPGDRLDAEFDRINRVIGGALAWAETSLNTDGSLRGLPRDAVPRSDNDGNHADGAAAVAQAYADVGMAWAEHMPDTIPPNLLVVQAVTGDHWSSRWWAHRASEYIYELEALLRAAPPLAVVYDYTYIATAGQTVFTGADRDGRVLLFTPGPQQTLSAHGNGLLRTPVTDYTATADTVTFLTPRAAGDVVQIQVEGLAAGGGYLPLTGGTLTGPLILDADPLVALGAATRQYVDSHPPLGGPYLPLSGGTLANLTVSGATTLNGATTAANLTVSGATSLSGLTVTGITSLAGTVAGSLTVTGSTALNAVTAGTVNVNSVKATNTVQVGDGHMQMYELGTTSRVFAFSDDWLWVWENATGDLTWDAYGVGSFISFIVDATPAPFWRGVNWLGPWQGVGAYIDASDERLKTDISDASVGLPEALAIQPIRFRRKLRDGTVSPRFEIGFSARRLEGVIPEAVVPIGSQDKEGPGSHASGDPFLGITIEPVVAALLNAVKTLTARIEALECKA